MTVNCLLHAMPPNYDGVLRFDHERAGFMMEHRIICRADALLKISLYPTFIDLRLTLVNCFQAKFNQLREGSLLPMRMALSSIVNVKVFSLVLRHFSCFMFGLLHSL